LGELLRTELKDRLTARLVNQCCVVPITTIMHFHHAELPIWEPVLFVRQSVETVWLTEGKPAMMGIPHPVTDAHPHAELSIAVMESPTTVKHVMTGH
jgi:hypothetical protein